MTATDLPPPAVPVQRILVDAEELVGPAVRRAVDQLSGRTRVVAGYHFGWLDGQGQGQPAGSSVGKMVRPALALLSAQAVGGHVEDAVPVAVAVELVHNFTLLHDDIMDGDRVRRRRPTAWAAFGVPAAVLAGDALWALALQVLADTGPIAVQGMRMLTEALRDLMDGQCADMDFERRADVSLSECDAMAAGKTGALLGCACALGALSGGACPRQIAHLRRFGQHLGLAFQLVDDLLGIWGDPEVTGKPVGADLASRKKSLPVVAALDSRTRAGEELAELYLQDRQLTRAEIARAAQLIETAGGRDWAVSEAENRTRAALRALARMCPAPSADADFRALVAALTVRGR